MKTVCCMIIPLLGFAMVFQQIHGESIDELIAASSTNPGAFDLMFDQSGDTYLVELDMVYSKEEYDARMGTDENDEKVDSTSLSRGKRKAIKATSKRWTSKTIPYKLARGVFSRSQTNQVNLAIQEWQKYTCLKFRPARSTDRNRIYLDNGGGCYSYVGMTGGSQKIGLAPGCRVKGVIVHEIGHAVGFQHEQTRPDRDNHVRIMRQNIPSSVYYNFKKFPWSLVTTHNVPYDYGSIMHYGGRAFSTNGQYTIRTVNPKDQHKIGNRRGMSFFDIKLANIMYSCNDGCSKDIKCPGHGFVGKDCKCWCPGNPVRECTGTGGTTSKPGVTTTTRPPVTTTNPICIDRNRYCKAWATSDRGYCTRNTYVKTFCKKSCNLCSSSGSGKGVCNDIRPNCLEWKQRGFCKGRFESFMTENCARTCEVCIPRTDLQTDGLQKSEATSPRGCLVTAIFTSLIISITGTFLS